MSAVKVCLFVLLIAAIFTIAPMLLLWALNTISEQAAMGWYIPHNVKTYLAACVICAAAGGSKS